MDEKGEAVQLKGVGTTEYGICDASGTADDVGFIISGAPGSSIRYMMRGEG